MTRERRRLLRLLVASACLAAGRTAAAQEVAVVLSAASGPYQAVYESFVKSYGGPVVSYHLPEEAPAEAARARVVVAIGGEAALRTYSERTTLIVCLAPGLAPRSPHGGPFAFVAMKPSAEDLLARLRTLQPGLKRLAVLWNAKDTEGYIKELNRAAAALGIEIRSVRVAGPEGVPDALRALPGKADALWLAPDPNLVTPEAFQTIKQFSWDDAIPFYAPTAGLVSAGAAAGVSVSAQESGREAAELVRRALSGAALSETVYPRKSELTLNPESAAKAGLVLTPEILGLADKVIR
jgi:putative ABC transport system substrate-binding protein